MHRREKERLFSDFIHQITQEGSYHETDDFDRTRKSRRAGED